MNNNLMNRYPSIHDLERLSRRRIPHFAWEFVDSGTGNDHAARRNREAFAKIRLTPQFMKGQFEPDVRTRLFGVDYNAPFGVSPVGMSGLLWPRTEQILARSAAKYRIPYALSTASNATPEEIGKLADGMGWFQLYPPRNSNVCNDLMARARDSGFTTLLITVDTPTASRRERQTRAGVGSPPRVTPSLIAQCALRPGWVWALLRNGMPRFPGLEKYMSAEDMRQFVAFIGREMNGIFDWDYLQRIRDAWQGPLVLKGVLDAEQAKQAVAVGVDGIMVSNHGGRQFDGAPATIEVLPKIVQAAGERAKILIDSGVFSGLDIARAIALGADFVLLGRAFMYGPAALGERGGDHATEILLADLKNNMSQLGCAKLDELASRVSSTTPHRKAGPTPLLSQREREFND